MTGNVIVSKRLVLLNSAGAAVTRVLNITVLLWVYQYLLTRLSPEEFSIYPVVMSVMMFVPILTAVFSGGVVRYLIAAYARGDDCRISEITTTMTIVLAGVVLVALAASSVFIAGLDRILTIAPEYALNARVMMGILIFSFFLRLPFFPLAQGLYMSQRFILQNAIDIGTQLLQMALLCVLLFFVSTSPLWLVVSSAAADFLNLFIRLAVSFRFVPSLRFRWRYFRPSLIPELLNFGFWQTVSQIAQDIRENSDTLVLNKLATSLDVNAFYLGSLVHRQLRSFSYMVTTPVQPALIALFETGQSARLRNLYLRSGRYALILIMALVTPCCIFSDALLRLYVNQRYSEYRSASVVMVLLLLTYPLQYGHLFLGRIVSASARVRPYALIFLISQIINLGLTIYFVWILHMGAVGSALATLIVTIILMVFFFGPLAGRYLSFSLKDWIRETAIPGFIPTLFGGAMWGALFFLIHPSGLLSLGMCGIIGLAVYAAAFYAFSLRQNERRALKDRIHGMLVYLRTLNTDSGGT
jgi:O-antigen/teichoic acid export membrane protein